MSIKTFKLLLVGDGGVGKTTFVKRHLTGDYEKAYIPTVGVKIDPLKCHTNYGLLQLDVWDTAGQEQFGCSHSYYAGAECAIIMFDVTVKDTYHHVGQWYRDILRTCGDIPVVLVGNKVDQRTRQVQPRHITFHRRKALQYYDISARSNYNYEKPFLYLLRKLVNDPQLQFVVCGIGPPPEIRLSPEQVAKLQQELEELAAIPLPDDDEEL
eukprot:TRINITY_DN69817_c0_g1_i1.p1 TRINITY_DN69817_c0_g1~~TRINITY_DN69817_c0_g1_i1.p1  ORF type:complete len:211 (-),score=30.27 TRINITY_DN69817_c0_g1_i1:48-680(-)